MPGFYIWTSPLKSAYVGTTPIKEIYVGTTKVRPDRWQPSSKTLAYMPFKEDLKNKMTNAGPTSSTNASLVTWTAPGWYLNVSNGYAFWNLSESFTSSQARTYNVWFQLYSVNTWNRRLTNIHWAMDLRITWTQRQSYQSIPQRTIMSQGDTDSWWRNNWFRTDYNTWHNLCIIFNGTNVTQYYDKNKLQVWIAIDRATTNTVTQLSVWVNNNYDRYDWRVSELILEKWNRAESDIFSYYDTTKSDYWL